MKYQILLRFLCQKIKQLCYMAETQKNIIENLLKEKKKTKRELAKLLNIKENSINRTLKNSNISLSKLGIIAGFLEVDLIDLLPKKDLAQEEERAYQNIDQGYTVSQLTISNLSEALKRNSKSIENLVKIMAENFPDKKSSVK
jgi:transcriptional regulator with XRE-family HTH domain